MLRRGGSRPPALLGRQDKPVRKAGEGRAQPAETRRLRAHTSPRTLGAPGGGDTRLRLCLPLPVLPLGRLRVLAPAPRSPESPISRLPLPSRARRAGLQTRSRAARASSLQSSWCPCYTPQGPWISLNWARSGDAPSPEALCGPPTVPAQTRPQHPPSPAHFCSAWRTPLPSSLPPNWPGRGEGQPSPPWR